MMNFEMLQRDQSESSLHRCYFVVSRSRVLRQNRHECTLAFLGGLSLFFDFSELFADLGDNSSDTAFVARLFENLSEFVAVCFA